MFDKAIEKAVRTVFEEYAKDEDSKIGLNRTIDSLKKSIRTWKDELADLKKEKELEKQEIEHLIKLKEERQKVELERQEVVLQKKFQEKEMALQNKYHERQISQIDVQAERMEKIYAEILGRLPNVNMKITEKR